MRKYEFNSIDDFAYKFLEYYENFEEGADDFLGISVVAHYPTMIDILNNLAKNTGFEMYDVSISPVEADNYCDEWILIIDSDGLLWVQEAKYESGYLYDDSNIIFVHSDVNSAFVVRNKNRHMIEFDIGDECDNWRDDYDDEIDLLDESNSESTHVSYDKDKTPKGFTKSWSTMIDGVHQYSSYSYYTDDLDELKRLANEFGVEL